MSFDRQTSSTPAMDAGSTIRWAPLVIGVLLGVIAMDIVVRRPLMREMALMRSNMGHMQREVEQQAAQRRRSLQEQDALRNDLSEAIFASS